MHTPKVYKTIFYFHVFVLPVCFGNNTTLNLKCNPLDIQIIPMQSNIIDLKLIIHNIKSSL